MTTQYACCGVESSASQPYNRGSIAPPPMATISREEPIAVNFPRPFIASGQIEGQHNELARPKNAMKMTETIPLVDKAATAKANPSPAEIFKARVWDRYFGISRIPIR